MWSYITCSFLCILVLPGFVYSSIRHCHFEHIVNILLVVWNLQILAVIDSAVEIFVLLMPQLLSV